MLIHRPHRQRQGIRAEDAGLMDLIGINDEIIEQQREINRRLDIPDVLRRDVEPPPADHVTEHGGTALRQAGGEINGVLVIRPVRCETVKSRHQIASGPQEYRADIKRRRQTG